MWCLLSGLPTAVAEKGPELRHVADPWYTGDFETTFQDILEGCEAMLKAAQQHGIGSQE